MDFQQYKQMGYTDAEIYAAMNEITAENQGIRANPTMIVGQQNQENLIKWQLELDSILERVEHLLRGDKPTMRDGNMIFLRPQTKEEEIFNDFGVSEIMRILSLYLNRNTILSNYDEDTINWKMLDFGYEVNNLIFLKYNEMGLDTISKRKRYAMIVREIIDTVHSTYRRALFGGERNSLRSARSVTQTEPLNMQMGGMGMGMMPMYNKERSILNPMRYIKGKYA